MSNNTTIVKTDETPRFTVEEIRNYITSRDSLGDVLYFLNADNIKSANLPQVEEEEEEL